VIPAFKSAAEELLKNSGLSEVDLLAKALAKAVVSQFSSSFSPFFFFLPCHFLKFQILHLRGLSRNV
jgi:hypothetical protein